MKPGFRLPDFVVIGTPSGGTRRTAHLIEALGLRCYHERVWQTHGVRVRSDEPRLWGSVDHAAVKWLDDEEFKPALWFHLVRNPRDTVRSMLNQAVVGNGRAFWDVIGEPPGWAHPGPRPTRSQLLLEANWYWYAQHKLLLGREDRYGTYRIEDESVQLVSDIFTAIGALPLNPIEETVENCPRVGAFRGEWHYEVEWDDLTPAVIELAEELGYLPE